jgi:hypothetical protein
MEHKIQTAFDPIATGYLANGAPHLSELVEDVLGKRCLKHPRA